MSTNYGRDVSCTTALKPGRLVTGARLVGEAAYRRLTTPRGMLRGGEEEADYGIDLSEMVGSVATKADAAALGGRIRSELTKDERIFEVDVRVIATSAGPATEFDITVTAETTGGPFTLVLAASEVTTALVGLEAEG